MSQTAPVMRTPGKAPLPGPMDEEGGKSTQAATPGTLKKKRKRNMRLPINVALGTLGVFFFFLFLGRRKHGHSAPSTATPMKHRVDTGQPNLFTYKVVAEYSHDPEAFTQGLEFERRCKDKPSPASACRNILWESTGLNGRSTVREVDVVSGQVIRRRDLERRDFGEGMTKLHGYLYQITWRSPRIIRYKADNFDDFEIGETPLQDGWGITNNGTHLIVGDSSHKLYYLDPETYKIQQVVEVTDNGKNIVWLNELEWIDGLIYANVYQTDCIAQIDPSTGNVVGWVDLSGLKDTMLEKLHPRPHVDVLNGIAWNSKDAELYVTGKLWPKLYQIQLQPMYVDSKSTNVQSLTESVRNKCILRFT